MPDLEPILLEQGSHFRIGSYWLNHIKQRWPALEEAARERPDIYQCCYFTQGYDACHIDEWMKHSRYAIVDPNVSKLVKQDNPSFIKMLQERCVSAFSGTTIIDQYADAILEHSTEIHFITQIIGKHPEKLTKELKCDLIKRFPDYASVLAKAFGHRIVELEEEAFKYIHSYKEYLQTLTTIYGCNYRQLLTVFPDLYKPLPHIDDKWHCLNFASMIIRCYPDTYYAEIREKEPHLQILEIHADPLDYAVRIMNMQWTDAFFLHKDLRDKKHLKAIESIHTIVDKDNKVHRYLLL